MNEIKWNVSDFSTRLNWCSICKWNNRTAQKLAKQSWEQLSSAAKNVLIRHIN